MTYLQPAFCQGSSYRMPGLHCDNTHMLKGGGAICTQMMEHDGLVTLLTMRTYDNNDTDLDCCTSICICNDTFTY